MTIFVLNQGYCPKQSIRTRQPTPEESIESEYNIKFK